MTYIFIFVDNDDNDDNEDNEDNDDNKINTPYHDALRDGGI